MFQIYEPLTLGTVRRNSLCAGPSVVFRMQSVIEGNTFRNSHFVLVLSKLKTSGE